MKILLYVICGVIFVFSMISYGVRGLGVVFLFVSFQHIVKWYLGYGINMNARHWGSFTTKYWVNPGRVSEFERKSALGMGLVALYLAIIWIVFDVPAVFVR